MAPPVAPKQKTRGALSWLTSRPRLVAWVGFRNLPRPSGYEEGSRSLLALLVNVSRTIARVVTPSTLATLPNFVTPWPANGPKMERPTLVCAMASG